MMESAFSHYASIGVICGGFISLVIGKQTLLDRIAEENRFDSEIIERCNVRMEWVYSTLREKGIKT